MARYAIHIFDNAAADDYTPEQQVASKRHADDLIDSGAMITTYALQSTDTATSLRGDVVTDGPFIAAAGRLKEIHRQHLHHRSSRPGRRPGTGPS